MVICIRLNSSTKRMSYYSLISTQTLKTILKNVGYFKEVNFHFQFQANFHFQFQANFYFQFLTNTLFMHFIIASRESKYFILFSKLEVELYRSRTFYVF